MKEKHHKETRSDGCCCSKLTARLLLLELEVEFGDVLLADLHPAGRLHVINLRRNKIIIYFGLFKAMSFQKCILFSLTSDHATRHGVAMSGVIDGLASELIGLRVAEVPSVVTVEHTVRVRRAAAHREDVVREASAIVADIVQAGALVLIFFPA